MELDRLRAENEKLKRERELFEREKEAARRGGIATDMTPVPARKERGGRSMAVPVAGGSAALKAARGDTNTVQTLPFPNAGGRGSAALAARMAHATQATQATQATHATQATNATRATGLTADKEDTRSDKAAGPERGEKPRPSKDAPEHQRPRAASEGQLKGNSEKIRWKSNRVNATSGGDAGFEPPALKVASPGGRAGGRTKPEPASKAAAANLPLIIAGIVGALLFIVLVVGLSKRLGSMREDVSQSQEALRDAERLAEHAIRKAQGEKARLERERRLLEKRQSQELRRAREEARRDGKREAQRLRAGKELELRERLDAESDKAREAEEALDDAARKLSRAKEAARREREAREKEREARAKERERARRAAKKAGAPSKVDRGGGARNEEQGGPPAPGWPSKVLRSKAELNANGFQVVSVTGIRVGALPSAGCSPCQADGTLSDGSPVTLIAPSFTPFVPAKMAAASRVAVKGLVQPKPDGSVAILVQSVIRD